jgi:hypothetical protein
MRLLTFKEPEARLVAGVIAQFAPPDVSIASSLASTSDSPHAHTHSPSHVIDAPVAALPKVDAKPTPQGFCRVKFLAPVDQFVGQELELYGPFEQGEEAELPATVAEVLLAQKSAMDVSVRS